MVTLTVDGVEVTVERGTSILEAAQKAGRRIPTLCHDKRLIPFGACRLCIVEVTARGRTRRMPACFNPARDGMVVTTHSPKLTEIRRMQLQLLLRTHPLLCPSCDAAGNCQLQNLVHEYEIAELPFPREARYFHVDNDSHFIRFNMNLCIRCGMCVRICDEVQGQTELSFVNRGIEAEISTDFGRPLDCEFCGQCASVCPVGAITSKWLVGTGREFELKKTDTVCAFCSLGCILTLGEKGKKIVYVTSPSESPNEGNLCVKGRYGWPYIYSSERLTKPLIRKNGELQAVEWTEAFGFVVERLQKIKETSGAPSLAGLGSERLTNEEAYVFNRFVRTVLETPHLDHAGGFGYRPLVDGVASVLGYPAGTQPIRDIRKSKVILLVGADLTETHPVAKNEVILATGRGRAKAIVIDPVHTKLCERPGMHLAARPGTEHLVLHSMLKCILDAGLYDKKALSLNTEGLDELITSLDGYSPENVGPIAKIAPELIREAATEYVQASTATIILTVGLNRLANGVETAKAAANLALITGRIGKAACGLHVFGEKANAQGAIDMGLAPDLLPGFASMDDPTARARFEAAWGAPLPTAKGMCAQEIFAGAHRGEIKGVYIVGENPVDTYPERQVVEQGLGNLDLLIVQDMFLSSTAKMAHVVLPVVSFAEKYGTFTSAERVVQRLRPVMPAGQGKSDLEIFTALAVLMGKADMSYAGPEQVMAEISELVDVYRGISYDRLAQGGIPWPCVDGEDPGKATLYEGGFPHGKARFAVALPLTAPPDETLPFWLIPRVLKFHSGSFSQWSSSLMEVSPAPIAEMDYSDLRALGIKDGEEIAIVSSQGDTIKLPVKCSERARPGIILVPQHFSSIRLNTLTRWGYPGVPVRVEKA